VVFIMNLYFDDFSFICEFQDSEIKIKILILNLFIKFKINFENANERSSTIVEIKLIMYI